MTPTQRRTPHARPRPAASVVVRAVFCFALLLAPATTRAEVKVEKKPPAVEYRTFDPASPPDGMPPLTDGEPAVTAWELPCDVDFLAEATQRVMPNDKSFVTYRVRQATVTLSLKVVVWLPAGADERLKAHQDGHRRIAEQAYEKAEVAARQAAAKIDGRRVGGEGPSLEAAGKKAAEQVAGLNGQLTAAYRDAVVVPAMRVQEIYDELTGHGSKATPDVTTAVKLAFQRQAAEAKQALGKPATRPVTRPSASPSRTPGPATRPATRAGKAR